MDARERIEQALEKGVQLSTSPEVFARIAELCRDPRATARDLGKVLQLDTGLTTRVLKQVNSSFYGLSATIKTVTHAVVILGFQEIKNIALSVPVADLFQNAADDPGIDIPALWDRSIRNACLARRISYHIKHPVPEQIFVGGMLADAGMVLLNSVLGEDYADVVDPCRDDELLRQFEEDALGITHNEVGRRLAAAWRFPPDLVNIIAHHDYPFGDEGALLQDPALLFVAMRLTRDTADGLPAEEILAALPPKVAAAFALDAEAIQTALDKGDDDLAEAKAMLAAD